MFPFMHLITNYEEMKESDLETIPSNLHQASSVELQSVNEHSLSFFSQDALCCTKTGHKGHALLSVSQTVKLQLELQLLNETIRPLLHVKINAPMYKAMLLNVLLPLFKLELKTNPVQQVQLVWVFALHALLLDKAAVCLAEVWTAAEGCG